MTKNPDGTWTLMLDWHEIELACLVGIKRSVSAIAKERQLEPGRKGDVFGQVTVGCIAEYCLAKAFDRFWDPKIGELDSKTGDVAGMQAKGTTRFKGCLIVHEPDSDDDPFVLGVMPRLPYVHLIGWAWGAEIKVQEYFQEVDLSRNIHRAAYFYPQKFLRPMRTLVPPQERAR